MYHLYFMVILLWFYVVMPAMASYGESHLKTPCILDGSIIYHPSWHRLCIILHARPLGNRTS